MNIVLDHQQSEVLDEILRSTLTQLRIQSARTDAHDFREQLHERERVVESVIDQLQIPARTP